MPQIDQRNQAYAALLGWSPSDFGASAFDGQLAGRLAQLQARHPALDQDSVCGPSTYRTFLQEVYDQRRLELTSLTADARLRLAGELAINRAKWLWLARVTDPPNATDQYQASRALIDGFIRGVQGLGWSWEPPYVRDGEFEWCGAFAAWAWGQVGLGANWRTNFLASTYRLDRFGRYLRLESHLNPPPADPGEARRYRQFDESSSPFHVAFDPRPGAADTSAECEPRAGDILLVGTGDFGSHITLVERYDLATGTFATVEGNGTGVDPQGVRMHGVVRAQRRVGVPHDAAGSPYHARRLIRPSLLDLA
jgi:hypothetical protein